MANKNLTFIQLNIGGVAEHSNLTFNNHLETHKPTICFLNETKRQLDKDFAVNYFTESTCRGVRSDGVAIIISKDLSYTRLNELELKDYDSIWILMVVAGLKILIGTAYLKPSETAPMEKFIKQREKVVNFYHQHNLDGVLFLGNCNARPARGVIVYAILTVICFWKVFLLKTTFLITEKQLFCLPMVRVL